MITKNNSWKRNKLNVLGVPNHDTILSYWQPSLSSKDMFWNSRNWLVILMPATDWQIFDIQNGNGNRINLWCCWSRYCRTDSHHFLPQICSEIREILSNFEYAINGNHIHNLFNIFWKKSSNHNEFLVSLITRLSYWQPWLSSTDIFWNS